MVFKFLEDAMEIVNQAEVLMSSNPGTTTFAPTGEELHNGLPNGQVTPTVATSTDGDSLELEPLWDLLAAAGYQKW